MGRRLYRYTKQVFLTVITRRIVLMYSEKTGEEKAMLGDDVLLSFIHSTNTYKIMRKYDYDYGGPSRRIQIATRLLTVQTVSYSYCE